MKRYYITIVNLENGTTSNLVREGNEIDELVEKELGGWNNLLAATTSNTSHKLNTNQQMCGTTKDGTYMFSILSNFVFAEED